MKPVENTGEDEIAAAHVAWQLAFHRGDVEGMERASALAFKASVPSAGTAEQLAALRNRPWKEGEPGALPADPEDWPRIE